MPTTSLFTSTGALKFTNKKSFVATPQSLGLPNPFQNLLACYIVTDVQNISFFVKINGIPVIHFINDNVVSWELSNNVVVVKTKDEVVYSLSFVTASEAILANERIDDNINGLITFDCGITSNLVGDFNSDFSSDFFN